MNIEEIKSNTNEMILRFAVPSIIAMILSALVTVVDGYFIGNFIGEKGLTAINLGLPIVYLYLALGIMVGVGGISIAGRLLGRKKVIEVNHVFNQTIMTTLVITVVVSILMGLLFSSILSLFHFDIEVITHMKEYFYVMFITYTMLVLNIVFGMFIRGEGNPEKFMLINIIVVSINIALDYLFISVLKFGIRGIAFASLIAVGIGTLLMIQYFRKNAQVFKFGNFNFSTEILKETIFNGSSEFIGQFAQAISITAYNIVLLKLAGINGIAAFTIIGYSAYIFNMIVIGFGQGASPLISFSYGANQTSLSKKIRNITNGYVFVIGLIIFIALQFSAGYYGSIFVNNSDVQTIIQEGIKLFPIAFLLLGINVISSFYFTSIGKAKESAVISGFRGLFILLIAIVLLPSILGLTGVWLVAPVTEGITLILTLYFLAEDKKNLQVT